MHFRTTSSRLGKYKPKSSTLEITEVEITGTYNRQEKRYPYPQHISQQESSSHRGYRNTVSRIAPLPKTCNLSLSKGHPKVNAAVNILQYQLSDLAAKQNHLENMRRSLKSRLKAAKASGNKSLIDLLNDEFDRLRTSV